MLPVGNVEAEPVVPETEIVKDVDALVVKSKPFDFTDPQTDPIELAAKLVRALVDHNGLGLSAIQIGIPLRVFALKAQPKNIVCFNPTIVNTSGETKTEFEGCLSFPNLVCKVRRPFEVRVRYKQPNGEVVTAKWGGLTSRVVQHEIDHLDGILFYNRANKFHRDQAFRKLEEWKRAVRAARPMRYGGKEEAPKPWWVT